MFELLRRGEVYELDNPTAEEEHEYGFVTGETGFHEFVVIDRATSILHLGVTRFDGHDGCVGQAARRAAVSS